MRVPTVRSGVFRGGLAALAASAIACIATAIPTLLNWLSPSSSPNTIADVALGLLTLHILTSFLLVVWLLPACVVCQWVMTRRHVRGLGAALSVALAASALACGTLFLRLLDGPPSQADWLRRVPADIGCLLFVVAWFVGFDMLSPPAYIGGKDAAPAGGVPASPAQRAARTVPETLAIAAALAWTAILGLIGSEIMDFGGDGEYRLQSTAESPQRSTRACIVDFFEPGGALSGVTEEVTLLPVSETWFPKHRGLLIWESRHVDVEGVEWESERVLRVRVHADQGHPVSGSHAYSRGGFTARTIAVSGP